MRHFLALYLIAVALLLLVAGDKALATPDDYSHSINLAIGRWLSVQKPSGFLPYGFNFLADKESEPGTMSAPNLTRQTYTAAVLADYFALTKDRRVRPALRRLLAAFGRCSLPIGKTRLQSLVEKTHLLSMPIGRFKIHAALSRFGLLYEKAGRGKVLSPTNDYSQAYTGATALALLTEVRYWQTSGDASFSKLRSAWLEGLIELRIPGDGFRELPTSIDAYPYFDGEAWLALAQYHRAFPQDHRVGELLADLDDTLMNKYERKFSIDFFSWGTMAAATRFDDTNQKKFINFIKAQTKTFLRLKKAHADPDNTCSFVEGLADALGALLKAGDGGTGLAVQERKWVATEMQRAMQLQIKPGQQGLVYSNARIFAPSMQEYSGSFLSGRYAADTRVDFTAHCVSAMVKLERNQENASSMTRPDVR